MGLALYNFGHLKLADRQARIEIAAIISPSFYYAFADKNTLDLAYKGLPEGSFIGRLWRKFGGKWT